MKQLLSILILMAMCLSVFVGCNNTEKDESASDLDSAVEYVFTLYKDVPEVTASDYEVVSRVAIGSTSYDVEWSVDVEKGVKVVKGENTVTIDVDEKTAEEINYTLTATVKDADGKSATKEFKHKVPAYKVNTWADYMAAKSGDNLVVSGIVSGIISKSADASNNCIFIQDPKGGAYYVYGMDKDPIKDCKIEIGMTVEATGIKDVYNGTHELKQAKVTITDSNKTDVGAVDYTEIYKNAADLKDKALVEKQSMLVTIKGVEITGQDEANKYYRFKLGDKETYVRLSGSTCAISKADCETFKKAHAEHFGWTANVTGIISLFNGSFYLVPVTVDAFEYLNAIEKTPEEKVEIEEGNIKLKSIISKDTEIKLPVTGSNYEDVKIAWTSDNACAVIGEDGTLKITMPEKDAVLKLTATITCGEAKKQVEFTIKLQVRTLTYGEIVDAAYALEAGKTLDGVYRLFGKVESVDTPYSPQYKNVTVTIQVAGREDKPIICFRLSGEGVDKIVAGDEITVEGTLQHYVNKDGKGSFQLVKGKLIGKGEIIDQSKILENAYALGQNETMPAPSVLRGVITKIDTPYSDQYHNVSVVIEVDGIKDKPMLCFRLKGEGADKLEVGQTITVFGTIKNYNGKVEFDAGCMLVADADYAQARTVAELYGIAGGEVLADNRTLTGVITKVDTPYSDQFKNVTVTIQVAGLKNNPVTCFRLKGEGADKLAEGDVITVTGQLTHYQKDEKNSFQFAAGATFVK